MIPFSPPRIDNKIVDEVSKALTSGWITTGPRTKALEVKIGNHCGVPKVLCLSSATAGMELMLRHMGIGPGDEVIIPAYTYCATANVVCHTGATPVMVDVNEGDFNINVELIKKAITKNTKAIIPVDFAGLPCDYDDINDLVQNPEIKALFSPNNERQKKLGRIMVMSDAAHSFGGIYYGTNVGSLCDVSVFSFHAVKNLTTAEGGAICLNFPSGFDMEQIYKELNTMSLHGQSKDAFAKAQKGAWEYDVIEPGYKCNMTDILASIALVEIDRYDEDLAKRKEIFDQYATELSKHDWAIIPPYETDIKISSYHVFALRIKNITVAERNEIIQKIFDKDVSVNVHFKPLPMLTAYKKRGHDINDYPVALSLFESEISLPVYFNLTKEQVNTVIKAVASSVQEVIK
ncbi:MAG: dTDP-4-amino-4,6-dideoxygalactose transaminase [Saprospiraceae bacterium]|jgi:dTDP-4-amino-4,6-dideoxygalactose transaminase